MVISVLIYDPIGLTKVSKKKQSQEATKQDLLIFCPKALVAQMTTPCL